YAFHDYYGNYYQRNKTHPNMGYDFISPETGLDIEISWPSSDLEMMEASVDMYLSDPGNRPFHAYYMTFSGHYQYNWVNPMSARNKRLVSSLPYKSETVLAYIACNIELEKALTYLVERLEEAGEADNTVIVLSNDHYPYGLKSDEYNEMAGKEIDVQFEKYRNSFICWTPSIKEPIVVDAPCCTIDILPTLLNLFGVQYDSRLLCGVDVLADNVVHIAILSNQSFITKDVRFSSSNNTVEFSDPLLDESDVNLTALKNYVKNVFTVSSAILEYDYYSSIEYVFGEDEESEQPVNEDPDETDHSSNGVEETAYETAGVLPASDDPVPVPTDPTVKNG
ncbi:MAG: sulfatase-like hydrolase/transferase, partial [Clostridia bacterium]|nr:sulfatase-like hydrolase/transferase [Clostridia bacterium]